MGAQRKRDSEKARNIEVCHYLVQVNATRQHDTLRLLCTNTTKHHVIYKSPASTLFPFLWGTIL